MKCFLILEDEPLIAMDLQFAFEDAGHDAVTAVSCEEACELIDQKDLAGAVLDVSLGGGQTCEQAARELAKRRIPFVLHTGDLDRAGEYLRNIEAPVIPKPRPSDDVVRQVLGMVCV